MSETINVRLFDGTIVPATLIKNNRATVWVRLPASLGGKLIKRSKAKHVVK